MKGWTHEGNRISLDGELYATAQSETGAVNIAGGMAARWDWIARAEKAEARVTELEKGLREFAEHHQLCADEDLIRRDGTNDRAMRKTFEWRSNRDRLFAEKSRRLLGQTDSVSTDRAYNDSAASRVGTGDTPPSETEDVLARTSESAEIIGPPGSSALRSSEAKVETSEMVVAALAERAMKAEEGWIKAEAKLGNCCPLCGWDPARCRCIRRLKELRVGAKDVTK